ncbi:hypothetical protein [Calothrix sp. CCY 0018]|uniref:hypothetical protein n=1 Tax=Calothrix sp. CCY 0018 TaxID=3103864 RepID=UPI0039C67BF5
MISPKLLEIDRSIRDLSLEEQMWLLESLVKNLRKKTNTNNFPLNSQDIEKEIAEMANDNEIKTEIHAIDEEFAITQMDGLEKQ